VSAYARVTEALNAAGSKGRGTAWQCVAHEDRSPSLSVTNGREGVLLNCHAGCATEDVVNALGLSMADLFDEPLQQRERPQVVAEYPYTDEHGQVLYLVRRIEPGYDGERKTFRQYRPDGKPGVSGIRRVLYRLPDVIAAAQAGGPVFVVEGEKDVENLAATGATATCNVGGAGKWSDDYTRCLAGASEVIIIRDRDEPGRKHAEAVAESVQRAGIPVRVLEPAQGKDVSDHLAAGLSYEDLVTPESHPANPRKATGAQDADTHQGSGISGTSIADAGWDEPVSLDSPSLPPFPVDLLGGLGEFVTAAAESLQVPVDLVAFAALATISTATGGRRRIQVKPDWHESTALYLAALADSSEKKTPALNAAAAPLRAVEDELIDAARPEVEATAQEIRITTARMTKAEQNAANAGPDKRAEAEADAEAARVKLLELGDAPEVPRLLVRDITLEALAKRMYEQGGRIGSLASEGGLFKVAAGLYGNNGKANTDLLLEAYTGGPYTIDRTGRASARMAHTFLALGLIVQPGIISGLEKQNPEFRQSGLLGRFLYAKPGPTDVDTFDSPPIPAHVGSEYDHRIRDLVKRVWSTPDVLTMELSGPARQAFGEFYNAFARRRKPGGDLHDLADWAGKLRGQLVRIAACLTLYEDPGAREISHQRITDVLAMAPYFITHARAVFDLMGKNREGAVKPLRDVVAWLRARKDPAADFSARDVWQALKGREWAEDMDAMNDVLLQLEQYGWIALVPPPDTAGKRGRKPSPRFAVHPSIPTPPEVHR
jgi:5S rRNA maturation endonuclease (ribonuclease M5)